MKLTIVIPVYNEAPTVRQLIERVRNVPLDGLSKRNHRGQRWFGRRNGAGNWNTIRASTTFGSTITPSTRAKGAALRTGFEQATGDIVIVQDADLEYDPTDYHKVLAPILDGKADVVYGSRFLGGSSHRVLYFWHSMGNRLLTLFSNMMTDLNLTDMETCYKAFRREVLHDVTIQENRFGFEPEITAKVSKGDWRIYEVGISYAGRTYADGKKISWKDGAHAFWCILKYNLRP